MKERFTFYRSFLIFTFPALLFCCRGEYHIKGSSGNYLSLNDSAGLSHDISENLIKPYRDSLDKTLNHIIGYCETSLFAQQPQGTLGNFVCDLMLDTLLQISPHYTLSNCLCIMNTRGLRAPLPAGAIPLRRVFEIMPFENEAVIVKLAADETLLLFEKLAQQGGHPVSFNVRHRFSEGKNVEVTVNGKPLTDHYYIITSDYLAHGGDNMDVLKNAPEKSYTGYRIRDMIKDHIEKQAKKSKTITATLDERIEKL